MSVSGRHLGLCSELPSQLVATERERERASERERGSSYIKLLNFSPIFHFHLMMGAQWGVGGDKKIERKSGGEIE